MVPVITELAAGGAAVSVDTMRAEVAEAALAAGATIVNDVSGGLADPDILRVVAGSEATYVAMHWRAHGDRMTDFATYDGPGGVVAAVRDELAERVEAMLAAGVPPSGSCSTRGSGSPSAPSTTGSCSAPRPIAALGHPLLVGASRKSFLGTLLAAPDGTRPVDEPRARQHRAHRAAGAAGVWGLRVHDVRSASDASGAGGARTGRRHMTDELALAGAGVLGPPRRVRARAARGTAVRRGPGARPGGGVRGGVGRLLRHCRLRQARPRGQVRCRAGPRRPDRDPGRADRGCLSHRRSC